MPDLKLPKIPDRTPVKMTIQLLPDLADALQQYAAAYEQAYGKAETVVWQHNNGLKGYDGDTGAAVASPAGACSGVRPWTSPIAVKGRIVVGGDGHLCSWSPR